MKKRLRTKLEPCCNTSASLDLFDDSPQGDALRLAINEMKALGRCKLPGSLSPEFLPLRLLVFADEIAEQCHVSLHDLMVACAKTVRSEKAELRQAAGGVTHA
jgi:hypothetical protein